MARQKNDGKGRMGGRLAGSQNKVTMAQKEWIKQLVDSNRETFEQDLRNIESKERLTILISLLKFTVPQLQSMTIENQLQIEYQELQKLLEATPEKYIEQISKKIITLKIQNDETNS